MLAVVQFEAGSGWLRFGLDLFCVGFGLVRVCFGLGLLCGGLRLLWRAFGLVLVCFGSALV